MNTVSTVQLSSAQLVSATFTQRPRRVFALGLYLYILQKPAKVLSALPFIFEKQGHSRHYVCANCPEDIVNVSAKVTICNTNAKAQEHLLQKCVQLYIIYLRFDTLVFLYNQSVDKLNQTYGLAVAAVCVGSDILHPLIGADPQIFQIFQGLNPLDLILIHQ